MPFSALTLTSGKVAVGSASARNRERGPKANLPSLLSQLPSNEQIELNQVLFCRLRVVERNNKNLKGLILAQNERWRRGLGMQVGGIPQGGTGVRGSNVWVPTFGFGIAIRDGG